MSVHMSERLDKYIREKMDLNLQRKSYTDSKIQVRILSFEISVARKC